MHKYHKTYDVIVAGGGIAGISAALKAAQLGVSVLLIERYGFLGGSATAGMVSPFMKHRVDDDVLVKGVYAMLEERMRAMDGMIDNGFSALAFRIAAFEMLQKERVDILFHSELTEVLKKNDKIQYLKVFSQSQIRELKAQIFIDTTGDGQILYLSNSPWEKGNIRDGELQAMTLFYRMAAIEMNRVLDYVKKHQSDFMDWMNFDFDLNRIISVAGFYSNVQRAVKQGRLHKDVKYIFFTTLPGSGEASFNTTNILGLDGSSSADLTKAEFIGREQVWQVVELLKNEIPGFENSMLLETAVQVGVRETRRAVGEYVYTGQDIRSCRKFEDAIARGCYGIDIHGQKDNSDKMEDIPRGNYYEIPLRSLIVKNTENLLVAGRCLSANREGHAALRIMPTSAATGEACGALAGCAVKQKKSIRDISYRDIREKIKHNLKLNS